MTKFIEKVNVYIDGCSKGNPGPCAAGVIVLDDQNNTLKEFGLHVGNGTNQEAEYYALLEAFECLPDICTLDISIHSDSQLVIKQMNRQFRIHKKHLLELHKKTRQKENLFRSVKYYHVPESNKWIRRADKLADDALKKFLSGR